MTNFLPHFGKVACIVDTCSIINLDEIEIAGRNVLYYMRRSFDIYVCDAILDEFQRQRGRMHSKESSFWRSFLSKSMFATSVLNDDRTVLGPFYSAAPSFSGSDDAGERGNARLGLELLITRRFGHIVFVTDDGRARNAFLNDVAASFPGLHLWTSTDVVLYLSSFLLKEQRTTFDGVRAALRDLNAASAKTWEEISDPEKSALIKRYKDKLATLQRLKQVVEHWREEYV